MPYDITVHYTLLIQLRVLFLIYLWLIFSHWRCNNPIVSEYDQIAKTSDIFFCVLLFASLLTTLSFNTKQPNKLFLNAIIKTTKRQR